jgi:uncharacterized protein
MIHPNTKLEFISDEIGYGVVATKFIPAGTITWVLDKLDREFTPLDVQNMESIYQKIVDTYCYRNNQGNYILCWDYGRFVNHSFKSNCFSTAYDFEIAIRDIQAGEQLTNDYGYLNVEKPFKGIDEGTRRKIVYPDDLLKYHKAWDKKIAKVFPEIPLLPQPLKALLSEDLWAKVVEIANGEKALDSILNLHYNRNQPVNV